MDASVQAKALVVFLCSTGPTCVVFHIPLATQCRYELTTLYPGSSHRNFVIFITGDKICAGYKASMSTYCAGVWLSYTS